MRDAAIARKGTDSEWYYFHNQYLACFCASSEYSLNNGGNIIASKKWLTRAKAICRDISKLPLIPANLRGAVEQASQLNCLAADMLLEKSQGPINMDSATISGYKTLFSELHTQLNSAKHDNAKTKQIIRKTLFLYSGTALAELYVESTQPEKVSDVIEDLCSVFGVKKKLIHKIVIRSAWKHNQGYMGMLLDTPRVQAA